jgi:chromosome segregation protein
VSVRVKSVTIQGFKSFGERVRVEFTGKVNAVIGPNGSGKSNVIEAIRWASHTARTRELRVRESTELIFHGSTGKAPLNVAEVLLELENVSHVGAVNIARRLYRDGDSDLELHGKTVRVRDLHDVLRGSGLGPGGIAVVGQGEIGAVVSANPTTMLGYLEEAAGLSRATHRRAQSIERLEQAKLHLERAEDLAGEVRTRVAKLEVEARAAEEHGTLSAELQSLEAALSRQRVRVLREEIVKLERDILDVESRSQVSSEAISQATVSLESLRVDREERQRVYAETAAESERLLGEARALRERASAADSSVTALRKERASLETELETLSKLEAPGAPEAPTDALETLEASLAAARLALREAEASELQWRKQLADARIRRDKLEVESRAHREALARQSAERETLQRDLETIRTEIETVRLERTEQQPKLEEAKTDLEAAARLLERLEREAQSVSGRIAETGSRINELKGARSPLQKELTRLEAVRQSRAYLSEGPRRAVQSGVSGIVGPVSDLLRVPQHLETAIGAVLGRRVENIVVETGDVAKAVIDVLKRSGGRATFLPLDILRSRGRRDLAIASERGVLGFAADLVSIVGMGNGESGVGKKNKKTSGDDSLEVVLENLFGETLVIETLETALVLARKYRDRPRLVTLEGELLEAGGAVTGGRGNDRAGESFADARRLEEARAELDALEENLAKLEVALGEDRELASSSREAVARCDTRITELRRASEAARTALVQLETRLESLETRETSVEARLKNLQTVSLASGSAVAELPDLEPLDAGLQAAAAVVTEKRDLERAADAELREGKSRLAVYAERQRTFEQALARFRQSEQRAEAIRARLEELHLQELEWGQKLKHANPEIERLEREAAALDLNALKAALDHLETQRRSL